MNLRGIRGAITVKKNSKSEILSSTRKLLQRLASENRLKVEDIACVIFSSTKDLNAEFPAVAARSLGWMFTPLLCTNEIDVPGSVKKCVRVLLLVNSSRKQRDMKNVYLGDAKKLRPDIAEGKKTNYFLS